MSHRKNTEFVDKLNAEFKEEDQDSVDEALSDKRAKAEEFAKLLGESFKQASKKLKVGDRIKGQILVLGSDDVFVSTGTQHDGVISRRDLNNEDGTCPYKTGDTIELFVTQVRGSDIRLSRKPTDRNLAEDLEDAFDMMLAIPGRIVEVCKGGVRVNVKGKLAFCPISQIDVKHVENAEEYVGKSFDFRITQFSEGGRNIVVSRRKLLEEERDLNAGSFLEENKDGDVVQGKVVRLEKFGAFVELAPGVDGLVHISEMAWSRIGDPSEIVQVGQDVSVKILKRETVNGPGGSKMKISLSIKQASDRPEAAARGEAPAKDDPWSKYTIGQVVTGKVNRKEPYGLFVQLEPGITGLLHQSKAMDHPDFKFEKLKVGDSVTVQVGEIRASERRISLDVPRDPAEDDWKSHKQVAASFGTLGDQLKAALAKKK
ncbi:MAG: S1 RNA-binding domain-containing protein [Bdellovibrionota bacterium]